MNVYRVQFTVVHVVESVSPHAADPKNSRQQIRSSGDHSINIIAESPAVACSYVKSLEGGDLEVHLGITTEVASDVVEIPSAVEPQEVGEEQVYTSVHLVAEPAKS